MFSLNTYNESKTTIARQTNIPGIGVGVWVHHWRRTKQINRYFEKENSHIFPWTCVYCDVRIEKKYYPLKIELIIDKWCSIIQFFIRIVWLVEWSFVFYLSGDWFSIDVILIFGWERSCIFVMLHFPTTYSLIEFIPTITIRINIFVLMKI